ncbi:MAG: arginine repressor [Clostridia bacterium]|nr:arginine repressor [Clostridia bacterium]
MKRKRHEKILSLIKEFTITTQEELLEMLKNSGFDVTQATVSRDIKELKLIKTTDANNVYRYATMKTHAHPVSPKFADIFISSVISITNAMNDVVIKCYPGMANAACAALDSMEFDEIVGTLAGDDTIFVIAKSEAAAVNLCQHLSRIK